MKYIVLASGSKGNCLLIDDGKNVLLIDVGITKKELKNKLSLSGYLISDVDAVLVSHEHQDHIKSIELFEKEKIFTNKKTFDVLNENQLNPFEIKKIKLFEVLPLPLSHDCNLCLGFKIKSKNKTIVYIVDTGYLSESVKERIINEDMYIIESNYDLEMLLNSKRPSYLKSRIISDIGHLSNDDACQELSCLIGEKTKKIVFAHLSRDVNSPKKVIDNFHLYFENNKEVLKNVKIQVADQKNIIEGKL